MRVSSWLLSGSAVAAATLFAQPVFAQAAPQVETAAAADSESSTIVVTGSRIRVDPLERTSPVVTLDQEALAQTGLSSVAALPAAAPPPSSR